MKSAVKWGAILGAAVVVWILVVHSLGFYTTRLEAGQRADLLATVLPILAIVLALRERRTESGSPLSIQASIAAALVVGLVSVPITAGFLWWYHRYMNPQWLDLLVDFQRRKMSEAGASAQAMSQAEASQRASGTDGAQLLGALVGTAIIAPIIGLVAGFVMRRRSPARPA